MKNSGKTGSRVGALKWWQIALISLAVSFLGKLSGGNDNKQNRLYTKKLKQAPWAPPPWVFGPAWTINNFFLLLGLQKLIGNEYMPERRKLLYLQAMIWAIFFSFNYVYFKKRSTLLAAAWTVSDAVMALASLVLSCKQNKKNALNYLPLSVWTIFASSLAVYQAVENENKALI